MSALEHRKDYGKHSLGEAEAGAEPEQLLLAWLQTAAASEPEPNAMVLSTVDASGRPSSRIVLLRGLGADGLRFFTNYHSRKGQELAGNANAALLFFWPGLERQVRVEGLVSRLSEADSDAYFASRPHGSQLGALASAQSEVIAGREVLEQRLAELAAVYPEGSAVPRPRHWGGYRLEPRAFEFWQGGASRIHDRLVFTRHGSAWNVVRLSP